jgi:hypothetical protein
MLVFQRATKTLARPSVLEEVCCAYPEEHGFDNFVLMIGNIALMNASSCRCALAKSVSVVSVFDPVKESTSNSSTKRCCSFKCKVRQLSGST